MKYLDIYLAGRLFILYNNMDTTQYQPASNHFPNPVADNLSEGNEEGYCDE